MRKVLADEAPHAFLAARNDFELLLQLRCGLVGGDDEVVLNGVRSGDLAVGLLLLVESPHVGHNKARSRYGVLQTEPDFLGRVIELDGHPPARLESPMGLSEA